VEIENDSPCSENDAVEDLVAGLNAIKGDGTSTTSLPARLAETPSSGDLYKPAR
jgi:predicted extracellular nuclease